MPSSASPLTTQIYTLSLHDALPICLLKRLLRPVNVAFFLAALGVSGGLYWENHSVRLQMTDKTEQADVMRRNLQQALAEQARLAGSRSEEHRLNSSHLGISYAVFCFSAHNPDLHPFPTRRSSDLPPEAPASAGQRGLLSGGTGRQRGTLLGEPLRAPSDDRQNRAGRRHAAQPPAGAGGTGPARRLEIGRAPSELQSLRHLVCRLLLLRSQPRSTPFPYTTLFRSAS